MGITAALRLVALFVKCGRGSQERREGRKAPWGPERGGPPFLQSRGRREGMKNMIYIIAVYCCYLVPSEQHGKAGRHFYEEGIDGRP